MAVLTASNYHSNSIVGVPQVGVDVNVHETHSSPKFPIGYGFERADGAKFRYAQYGSATNAGVVVSQDISASGVAGTAGNVVIQSVTATAVDGEAIAVGAKGSHYAQLKLDAGINQYAGGYFHVCDSRGAGYTYRIKGNTETDAISATNIRLQFYEPLAEELVTGTTIAITGNPWVNLVPAVMGTDTNVCGTSASSAANNKYGWVQTHGIGSAISAASDLPNVGEMIAIASGTNGAIGSFWISTVITTGTNTGLTESPPLGICIHTGSNAVHSAIALNIGV